jgi:pimeloyl-ACP methyl ester carboxylesterase
MNRLAALRRDWAYRVYDDLGHVPMLEDPERVYAHITDFLTTTHGLEAA